MTQRPLDTAGERDRMQKQLQNLERLILRSDRPDPNQVQLNLVKRVYFKRDFGKIGAFSFAL
jgi:hypothetical protein